MRRRSPALLTRTLVTLAVTAVSTPALASPAHAVDGDVTVRITQLPGEFEAGAKPRTVAVVASVDDDAGERRCRKVRWSMVLRVSGVDLDQVEVDRVEQGRSFPVQVGAEGDTARLTDVRLDPGQLCRGRTVTAQYRIAFAEDAPSGEVRFEAQAFDRAGEVLQSASATTGVEGREPDPSPSESPEAEESAGAEESAEPEEEVTEEALAPPSTDAPDLAATSGSGGTPSLLGPGLIVGAILVFLGVGLLLRIRMRNKQARHQRRPMPPSYYPTR